jgi:hypothetical protein
MTGSIRDKKFVAERVEMDLHEFNACRFENCELVITGRGPIRLTDCFVDTECHFSFSGYAGRTLESLTGLYAVFPEAIEPILAQIRGDGTTWLK